MKRITSKRPSNFVGPFGLIGPGESMVVSNANAEALDPDEFIVIDADKKLEDINLPDAPALSPIPDETPPEVVTKPAKKSRTRKA